MLAIVVGVYALMSIVTFALFWVDKRAAMCSEWRIPEATLHVFEILGGFPGALFAQHALRHKSYKLSYRVVLWLIIALHGLIWGAMAWRWWS